MAVAPAKLQRIGYRLSLPLLLAQRLDVVISCWTGGVASPARLAPAIGVNNGGRREVLGFEIGASEAETLWTEFLRKLARRGLRGVKLVVSDAHEGLKAGVARVLNASWQRCRVHFMRNVLAHAGKQGRLVVSAFMATKPLSRTMPRPLARSGGRWRTSSARVCRNWR